MGLEQKREAQESGEEEEGVDNGPEVVCLKPKGKNWKRQARIKSGENGTKLETCLCKRPSHDNNGLSPNKLKKKIL